MRQSIEDVIAYTRRRIRNRIAELADGEYTFTNYLDDDGMGGDPVPITVTVRVAGDTLAVDFTGSGPAGARRDERAAQRAAGVRLLLGQGAARSGAAAERGACSMRSRSTRRRARSSTRVRRRAVGARSITCQKVAGAIFGAFRGVLPPERVMASGNDVVPAIVFSGALDAAGRAIMCTSRRWAAAAARAAKPDGMDAVHVHMTNTSNLPAEALENEYPLLVDEYALVEDSGGAGRTAAGSASRARSARSVAGTIFSVRSDSHTVGVPSGVFGGLDGRRARLVSNPGRADEEVLYSKVARIEMKVGDAMRIETPGGGGYGAPAERPLEALAEDLASGKVSAPRSGITVQRKLPRRCG